MSTGLASAARLRTRSAVSSASGAAADVRTPGRSPLLILVATVVLLAFQYAARADTLGVFSPGRGWAPMTGPVLPPYLHLVVAGLLLGVVPVLCARRLTGLSLRQLGLGAGRWRHGIILVAVGAPVAILAGHTAAQSTAMRAVYPLDPAVRGGFVIYAAAQFLYFGAWEVLFRGVLLFGLRPAVGGAAANIVQTALSVTAHFGRAINETFAALPAGLLFGWLSLRLRSIWYIAALHWLVGISMDAFILSRSGLL